MTSSCTQTEWQQWWGVHELQRHCSCCRGRARGGTIAARHPAPAWQLPAPGRQSWLQMAAVQLLLRWGSTPPRDTRWAVWSSLGAWAGHRCQVQSGHRSRYRDAPHGLLPTATLVMCAAGALWCQGRPHLPGPHHGQRKCGVPAWHQPSAPPRADCGALPQTGQRAGHRVKCDHVAGIGVRSRLCVRRCPLHLAGYSVKHCWPRAAVHCLHTPKLMRCHRHDPPPSPEIPCRL